MYDQQICYLFFEQLSKDNSLPIKKKVVLTYDLELRETLFEKFHIGDTYFEPLEHLQVNLVDLLSYAKHNDRYSYVLTLIDVFSWYVWAIPLKDKEGSTIHSELVNIFKNFGSPAKLPADNRSEFITSILKNTCNVFKIKLVYGHTRHPQSQGKIERFNQRLGRHLTKMIWCEVPKVQDYHWINILFQFVISYNKAPHEAHKKSPYEVFFGFKKHMVYDITLEDVMEDVIGDVMEDIMEDVMEDVTKNVMEDVTENIERTLYHRKFYQQTLLLSKIITIKLRMNFMRCK
ncbi:SCAN domain-containing protein 3-like [Gigaspora margarita]|uniref:SCAN domain-containing protein 3-like n=1 Tax=Gigaspora margarita TaxID=4874 RepID=A0A8H4AY94_GIGMA|nr:SCAN domain-containing protein 3-like [Gigaspora margarita]